jgi:hypothetical protein
VIWDEDRELPVKGLNATDGTEPAKTILTIEIIGRRSVSLGQ